MKKVIIIGGGIAGLTAGIYAQKAGFETVIYEKHIIAGGECTGWSRKGFHIDGCIHWLTGTKEGTGLNQIWKEVNALGDVALHQPEVLTTVNLDGARFALHTNLEQLRADLLQISPEDREEIEKLCEYTKAFYAFEPPTEKPFDLMNLMEKVKYMASMGKVGKVVRKLGKLTIREYLDRFKSPVIREAFRSMIPDHYSAYILPSTLGTIASGNGGIPQGGSLALAQRVEATYKSLGGQIVFGKEIKEILVENDQAKGVQFTDGEQESADFIVAACDVHITLEKLVGGRYPDPQFALRDQNPTVYPLQTSVLISLGVDADLSTEASDYLFRTREFRFEDQTCDLIGMKHYCHEPSFAPEGKSVVQIYFHANYDWWQKKRQNRDEYKQEKSRLAQDLIQRMEEHFPELAGKISLLDVATPITYERYTGAFKGSWMSYGNTPQGKSLMHDGKIKGVNNLYLTGQWLMPPGGLPIALVTGKWAIQRICKENKIKF